MIRKVARKQTKQAQRPARSSKSIGLLLSLLVALLLKILPGSIFLSMEINYDHSLTLVMVPSYNSAGTVTGQVVVWSEES